MEEVNNLYDYGIKTHIMPATTKLRIVYDASAKSSGSSLNESLYAGPAFGQNIFDIILWFCLHAVALIEDIEKAFLMVSVDEDDRNVLRFLWLDNVDREIPQSIVLRFGCLVLHLAHSPSAS